MPQIQVLPQIQSPFEQLLPYLMQAGQDIGKSFQQRSALKALQTEENPQQPMQSQEEAAPAQPTPAAVPAKEPLPSPQKMYAKAQLYDQAYGKGAGNTYLKQEEIKQKQVLKDQAQVAAEERSLLIGSAKDFYKNIDENRQTLQDKQMAVKAMEEGIMSGETGVFSSANIGSFLTKIGAPEEIRKLSETPSSKEFKSGLKTYISSTLKDAFKGTTNQREIDLAEGMLAEIGVGRDANLAAAWLMEAKNNIMEEKIRLVDDLIARGVPASKIPVIVNKQIQPFVREEHDAYFDAIRGLGKKK